MIQPIFILAPPRSFTSVVCGMMGQHPQLYGLPEVNLFASEKVNGLQQWHGRRPRHGILRAIAQLSEGAQSEEDVEIATMWLDEHGETKTGEIYKDLVAWVGERGLVDKSPIYVLDEGALDRIIDTFPLARFIHMTRHPVSTAKSLVGLRAYIKKSGGGMAGAASQEVDVNRFWLKPHVNAKEFLDSVPNDQWLRLRGEDLMTDPDLYLPQLCDWLGLRCDAEAIEAMKHPENSPYACFGPENAKYGNDPGFMEKPVLRPYTAKTPSLDDRLPEGVTGEISEATRYYATLFGYT
ncbi:MAG: sulfotransferase [Rhodobacteraceae bacterium]|nr:sulfotransferase [Paracoccaceae bacterium]